MPVVPLVQPEVQTRPIGAPQLAPIPRVTGIGEGLQNLGNEVNKVAVAAKERGDTVALLDASTQLDAWEQNNLYSENGAFSKRGKNAIGIPNSVAAQFDNDTQAIGKNLANEDQRIRFQQMMGTRRSQMMSQLLTHERKEMDDYGKSVFKGKNESGMQRIESNFDNQDMVNATIEDLEMANSSYMQKQGLSDEEIASENQKIRQTGYLRALGKKAVTDPDGFLESIKNGVDAEQVSKRSGQARGIRNNNPGNLRDSGDQWQGLAGKDDSDYLKFNSAADGLRAMAINLKNQQEKHGLATLNDIIAKYAPPSENDTEAYQKQAAQALGLDGDRPINLQDPAMLSALMTFMVKKENGNQPYPQGSIDRAASIALNGGPERPDDAPGEKTDVVTGVEMYDALPFEYQARLVRMAETMVAKQRSQFRADVQKRIKDSLAMVSDGVDDGSVRPTEEEFNKAYGYDEGPAMYEQFTKLHQTARAVNEVAVQTPVQQADTLEKNKPQAGEGYAEQDAKYKTLETAVVQVNKARADDPIAFAQKYGLASNEPLQLNNKQQLSSQLSLRATTAQELSRTYGVPLKPLTKAEASALSQALDKMVPTDQLVYFKQFHDGMDDPLAYRAAMSQLRPDSPVTAVAGAFVGIDGRQEVNDVDVTPLSVAQRLIEGEALLNPTKFDKEADGKPASGKVFPMPPDGNDLTADGLRPLFNAHVKDAFRGMPELANIAYQSFRAYYAAEAARKGDYSGNLNEDIANQAVKAVVGTVVEHGEGSVVAPWGMDETKFLDNAQADFESIVKEQGFERVRWSDVTLENTGEPGQYRTKVGAGYLVNSEGLPMIVSVWDREPAEGTQRARISVEVGGK